MTDMNEAATELKVGDRVQLLDEGRENDYGTVIEAPRAMNPGDPRLRVRVVAPLIGTRTVCPLVSDVRRVPSDEEQEIWLRGWIVSGEQICDDPEEYNHPHMLFVHEGSLPEIIRTYLAANGLTPPGSAAALPVLNTARPRLVFGDVPITERTPHGVWIANGPDPEPSYAVPCGGPSGCDDCRAYADLRQHLVDQIITLDEQHQREMAALSASRDSETAEPELVMGTRPDGSPWVVSAEFDGPTVRVDGHGALRLHGKAISPRTAYKLATGLLAAIGWLENDGAAKAEGATSLRGKQ